MAPIRSRHAVALIGACFAQLSFGQEQSDPLLMKHVKQIAALVDKNGDGRMSRDEFIKFAKTHSIENHGMEPEALLLDLDKDGDSRIAMGEIPSPEYEDKATKDREEAHELKKFKIADENGNGYLEGVEIVSFFHPPAKKEVLQAEAYNRLRRIDKNSDSAISLEEFIAEADPVFMKNAKLRADRELHFKLLDRDSSGGLSLRELMDYEMGHHQDLKALHELFEAADTNKDGILEHEELHESAEKVAQTDDAHSLLESWIDWAMGREKKKDEL